MSTFEEIMIAKEHDDISALDISAFSENDIVNLCLQRSEILGDQRRPGIMIRAWIAGDSGPLLNLAQSLGSDLIHRAAAVIWLEYKQIAKDIKKLSPRKVADIGCGYALFNHFLFKDIKPELYLIDLETSEERHFGFQPTGAAYSSLSVARQFLIDNGVDEKKITCLNPEKQDVMTLPKMDLAMSFISCGFHYPVATYDHFFKDSIKTGGGIILDLRNHKLDEELVALETYGKTRKLTESAHGYAARMMTIRG